MASRPLSQDALPEEDPPKDATKEHEISGYRHPTVYDAVAGRITAKGFIPKHAVISTNRDQASSSVAAVPPETALFKSRHAPTRYAEHDIYFSNERSLNRELPESQLLKALHCYASDFYSRALSDGGVGDWRSMDETALLALGIVMEESCREVLGKTGDLAFTEGEDIEGPPLPAAPQSKLEASGRSPKKRRLETGD